MSESEPVICPYCSAPAALVAGDVIYPHRPDLAPKRFWHCAPCAAWVGCHADGDGTRPLGRIANAETRQAKQRAHAAFDPLWRNGPMKRREAYAWLAGQLGIQTKRCHIGYFSVDECRKVVDIMNARTQ